MKIALDISKMHPLSKSRGIGVYAKNLYGAIKKYSDIDIELIEEGVNLQSFDVVHYPFFDLFRHTLPLGLKKPTVVTIHDLIPIQFSGHYPAGIKGKINWHLQKMALKNVNSIVAVSKTVKADIIRILGIPAEKISVVYSAPSEVFHPVKDKSVLEKIKIKYDLPDEFVLYVGNVNWNKNILNMTEGVLQANKNLVIIGSAFLDKTNLNHPEKRSFKSWIENYSDNPQIKTLGSLPEDEVVGVMNLADCLILVSEYEGFGLPILEAQACGIPIVTGDTSSMPEIAGKGAIEVMAPYPHDIVSGLKMVGQSDYRERLIKAGFKNLKRFSWEKTAKETIEVYKNATN